MAERPPGDLESRDEVETVKTPSPVRACRDRHMLNDGGQSRQLRSCTTVGRRVLESILFSKVVGMRNIAIEQYCAL